MPAGRLYALLVFKNLLSGGDYETTNLKIYWTDLRQIFRLDNCLRVFD